MKFFLGLLICFYFAYANAPRNFSFRKDGTFTIVHISDTHYRAQKGGGDCMDLTDEQKKWPCDKTNTTNFIDHVLGIEKPDLVVFTGDITDWATHTAQEGMNEIYRVAFGAGYPWSATMGNHDAESNLNRSAMMHFIVTLQDMVGEVNEIDDSTSARASKPNGPIADRYGNYYSNIQHNGKTTFRLWHLDSNINQLNKTTKKHSITDEQISWYESTLQSIESAPAVMFFHIPLPEYYSAIQSGYPISGKWNEAIDTEGGSNLFEHLKKAGDVKATFVGHDHTNDFCAFYEGINLCYEGSPGFQAYSHVGWNRRARVTKISSFGKKIESWKRVSEGSVVDDEILWQQDRELSFSHRTLPDPNKQRKVQNQPREIAKLFA